MSLTLQGKQYLPTGHVLQPAVGLEPLPSLQSILEMWVRPPSKCSWTMFWINEMSSSVIVRFLMVMDNMMIVYQKDILDVSKKCREVKNIFYVGLVVRNVVGGTSFRCHPHGLKPKNLG